MIEKKERITREFCLKAGRLQFFPKTHEEASFIEMQLLKMGFRWYSDVPSISRCVATGMYLDLDKTIMMGKSGDVSDVRCDSGQFEEKHVSDRDFMTEQFNRLAERMEALEARMRAMETELRPKVLDKPSLESPKPAARG